MTSRARTFEISFLYQVDPWMDGVGSISERASVAFVTKSGGLPGYVSIIMIVPDYDLGVTILVGGQSQLFSKLRKLVTIPLIEAIERMAFEQMGVAYGGTYGKFHCSIDYRVYSCALFIPNNLLSFR